MTSDAKTPEVLPPEDPATPAHPTPASAVAVRPPDAIGAFAIEDVGMARARKLANEVGGLIREKGLAVKIGRGEHIKVEGWCAIGALVGVTPKTEACDESRDPQSGELEGYVATSVAVRVETGAVIGRAMASCFFDEQEKRRDDGEWYERWMVNGRRNRHACMSMAQTRATSKCLGQVLRFIPVMAGFSGTPYEEMGGIDQGAQNTSGGGGDLDRYAGSGGRSQPAGGLSGGGGNGQQHERGRGPGKISEGQIKRLWAIAHGRARTFNDESIKGDTVVRAVFERHMLQNSEEVERGAYDGIVDEIEKWEPGGDSGVPTGEQAKTFD